MKKIFTGFIATCLISSLAFAQQTGDFSIGFPSPDTLLTRDSLLIYFHVPVSYQPGTPSKMIVGIHGLGNPKTPEEIRNYFAPAGDSIGAIIMCPAPYLQDQPRSKLVINIAIDSVLTWYDVDTTTIYLAGYSAGSDVASQYNLDNPKYRMKGLIWYAPGFFYLPALSSQTYFPPTCLCYGDADPISNILGQVDAIIDSFQHSPFEYYYNVIPGVAHTMEFPGFTNEMLECLRFIDDPANFVPDSSLASGIIGAAHSALFEVFPNPSSGMIAVRWQDGFNPRSVKVADACGKIRMEATVTPLRNIQYFDLRSLSSGVYFIMLDGAEGRFAEQVVLMQH